jgi:hypothetical protein
MISDYSVGIFKLFIVDVYIHPKNGGYVYHPNRDEIIRDLCRRLNNKKWITEKKEEACHATFVWLNKKK